MKLNSRHDRRQFIGRTLAATGALAFTARPSRGEPREARQADPDALARFRARLKGRLVLPTDSNYEAARRLYFWNPVTERHPALIARCAQADDVRRAVEFACTQGMEVAVRGGGHSPMGWGPQAAS